MAEMETLVDRVYRAKRIRQDEREAVLQQKVLIEDQWHQPETAFRAMVRGFRGLCPSCGQAQLFPKFLKPIEHCPTCQQDWTSQQADDFPAYVAILVTGHIMAPIIIGLAKNTELPLWGEMAIIISLAVVLMVLLLQPAKGAVIALQWWMGMHGLKRPVQNSVGHVSKDDR